MRRFDKVSIRKFGGGPEGLAKEDSMRKIGEENSMRRSRQGGVSRWLDEEALVNGSWKHEPEYPVNRASSEE